MSNIVLRLAYDGSAYHGWQRQKNALSVCEVVENALGRLTGEEIRLQGCGRTDAGVHARIYAANFYSGTKIPADRLPYALNARLPSDIAVKAAALVPDSFNSIGSCLRKEYSYLIRTGEQRDPFWHKRAYHYPRRPDIGRMRRAAADFTGTHDFRAVQTTGTVLKSTVRTLYSLEISEENGLVTIRMCANGFLYNMARAIAGTLLYVSEGKIDDIAALLRAGQRAGAGPVLPPHGLYMTGVWYKPEDCTIFCDKKDILL